MFEMAVDVYLGASKLVGMHCQLSLVPLKNVERDIQSEIDHEEELEFQVVDLVAGDASNLCVVRVVVVNVVVKLGC